MNQSSELGVGEVGLVIRCLEGGEGVGALHTRNNWNNNFALFIKTVIQKHDMRL